MVELTKVLGDDALNRLRASYDAQLFVAANANAMAQAYTPHGPWGQAIGATFFGDSAVLAPRQRELCLVVLLAQRGAKLPLANHLYWGLMEGLSVADICEAMGLAGCYGGLPSYEHGMVTLQRTLLLLARLADDAQCDPRRVLTVLAQELEGAKIGA